MLLHDPTSLWLKIFMVPEGIYKGNWPYLAAIYQTSIETGLIPSKLKHTNVCGVHKSGDKSNPANYRPTSLTCIVSKILVHLAHSNVMKHLEHYVILTDEQYCFT